MAATKSRKVMPRFNSKGFTLVEVMIVMAIVGILAAIAVPNYTQYVQRSHRSHARNALLQAAQWMERAATTRGTFPIGVLGTIPGGAIPAGLHNIEGQRYTFDVVATDAQGFTFRAVRNAGGPQANDRCGDFTLTNTGLKGIENNAASETVETCWGR